MNVEEEITSLERNLAEFERQIDQLETSIGNGNHKFKEDIYSQMRAIRQHRRYVEEQLGKARLAKAESWLDEDFLTGIMIIFDDIGQRIDSLFNRENRVY
jgi:hypothetical protein